MSQKTLRKKRQAAARAMPVETIRTRLKSSQVSQQQKVSSNNSNEITTKVNETYYNMKRTKNVKCKGKEKHQELEETEINKEFYPDKLKRLFKKKEIVLKPKPSYKLVGGLNSINKRKLRKPIKEIAVEQEIFFQNQYAEDSNTSENTIDLICLDDSDSLDEEDLMEILTCESPVWWEDPPDECYDEEPLSITMNDRNYNIKIMDKNIICNTNEHNNAQKKNQETKSIFSHKHNNLKGDKNFVTRQNKLESLLGNIKKKKSNETLENTDNKRNSSSHESIRQKKTSESFDEAVLDEEFLKTLENMEIPIENTRKELPDVEDASVSFETKIEPLEIHRKQEINTEKTFSTKNDTERSSNKSVKGLTIKKCDITQFKPKLNKKNVETSQKVQSIEEIDQNKMLFLKTWSDQCDMKVLNSNKRETEVKSQPKLSKTDNTVSGLTIQNFNPNLVQKQVRKRNRKRKSNINISNEVPKKTQKKSKFSKKPNANDEITVYKIVTEQESQENNDTKTESSKTYNNQLNSYYNQCKNITKSKKETDNNTCDSDRQSVCNNKTVKSIPVSNNETVKYCLQCSSIFDNDICNYCANKSNSDAKSGPNKIKTEVS